MKPYDSLPSQTYLLLPIWTPTKQIDRTWKPKNIVLLFASSMACMDTTYHIALPLHQSSRTSLSIESQVISTRPIQRPASLRYSDPTNSSFFALQPMQDRPQFEQTWQAPTSYPYQPASPYESWATDAEWRRPVSSNAIPAQSEWYIGYAAPADQYLPVNTYSSTGSARSMSQPPDRRNGRALDVERPTVLRQTTEASSLHHQYFADSAFRGDADYLLFAEATFGLSPDDPRHPAAASPGMDYFGTVQTPEGSRLRLNHRESLQSPQIAHDLTPSYQPDHLPPQYFPDEEAEQQARELVGPGQLHSFGSSPAHDEDDELPDYEQSQAEMHDRTRVEAVRRAQELQRRWREAHG